MRLNGLYTSLLKRPDFRIFIIDITKRKQEAVLVRVKSVMFCGCSRQ